MTPRTISVVLPAVLDDRIRAAAATEERSFSDMLRRLVRAGLDTWEQDQEEVAR